MSEGQALAWKQLAQCTVGADKYHDAQYDFRVSTTDYPTSGSLYPLFETAGSRWDGAVNSGPIAGTEFNVAKGPNTTIATHDTSDGVNTITAENLVSLGFIGQAMRSCNGDDEYEECDIRFEQSSSVAAWNTGLPVRGGTGLSLQATMLHEVGHCYGLAHVSNYPDALNSSYPFGARIGGQLDVSEDAREGARAIYLDTDTDDDVAVSAMRMTGSSNSAGYVPTSGGIINEVTSGSRGASITRAFCVHNLGTDSISNVVLKIYLSIDDNVIETTDSLMGTFLINLTSDQPTCIARSVTIPSLASEAPAGYHWIGAIVDPGLLITESDEGNNVARDSLVFQVTP